jgi:hypothetical protein
MLDRSIAFKEQIATMNPEAASDRPGHSDQNIFLDGVKIRLFVKRYP